MQHFKLISFKNQKEFDQVNSSGKKIICKFFILVLERQVTSLPFIYIGLKVSRKHGNAVVRNKIRRRLKHIIRDFVRKTDNNEWFGCKFLIVPKSSINNPNIKYSDIFEDLNKKLCEIKERN